MGEKIAGSAEANDLDFIKGALKELDALEGKTDPEKIDTLYRLIKVFLIRENKRLNVAANMH